MAHILNKLDGVKLDDIKRQLKMDAESHAEQGMYLEHLWRNADNPDEVYFLFRVDDLKKCKKFIEKIYAEASKKNPDAKLPKKIFLEDVKE